MPADRFNTLPKPGDHPRVIWLRAAAAFGTLSALALLAPFVWHAVSAGLGLLALAALGLAGVATVQALPLALQKLENRLLALRKAEARANPIEQLQNDVLRREERLHTFRQALVAIETRRRADPAQALDHQARALERMKQFQDLNLQRLRAAQDALDEFRQQVQQKVFEWEFYVAGKQVLEVLNPSELGELLDSLLSDEALRAVQQRFNEVFAELDVDLRAADSPARPLLPDDERQRFEALVLPRPALERKP